jgi:hypothetical protein
MEVVKAHVAQRVMPLLLSARVRVLRVTTALLRTAMRTRLLIENGKWKTAALYSKIAYRSVGFPFPLSLCCGRTCDFVLQVVGDDRATFVSARASASVAVRASYHASNDLSPYLSARLSVARATHMAGASVSPPVSPASSLALHLCVWLQKLLHGVFHRLSEAFSRAFGNVSYNQQRAQLLAVTCAVPSFPLPPAHL